MEVVEGMEVVGVAGCGGCWLWRLLAVEVSAQASGGCGGYRLWGLQVVEAAGCGGVCAGFWRLCRFCRLWRLLRLQVVEAADCGGCRFWRLPVVEATSCGGCRFWGFLRRFPCVGFYVQVLRAVEVSVQVFGGPIGSVGFAGVAGCGGMQVAEGYR
jgi:hypothetical protein